MADQTRPKKSLNTIAKTKTKIPEQPADERRRNFKEVALGYTEEQALAEAERCLQCKNPKCIEGCPVEIDIPAFIARIVERDYRGAYDVLKKTNVLPAVCGRVCPQEVQCESKCIVGRKLESVGIGRLERFAADQAIRHGWQDRIEIKPLDVKAAIVGSGPVEAELKKHAAQLGLNHVHFLGMLPDEDKVALLHLCYGVIFPSHLRSEAFGISLLEGAMYGKPMISSEIGTGTTFINIGGETGLVVAPSDPVALRQAMQYLWEHPEEAAEMGKRAEERYWQHFTAEQMVKSYVDLYRELLRHHRDAP